MPMMRKAIFALLVFTGLFSSTSCTKDYHCACTYNNAVVYNIDLGVQYKDNAQAKCAAYDSTIKGMTWQCSLY